MALWLIRKGKSAKWILGLVVLDLMIYSQVTLPATVYSPCKRADYETYFNALPQKPDQLSATVPYNELIENYEPKMMGIWRNTATYHKSLTFDGHNQTQFIAFNKTEQNGGLEFAKENALFYEVAERIDLKKDTIKRPSCLWEIDVPVSINRDTLRVSNPTIGCNQFSVQINNQSKQSDLLILNQNFHTGWSAKVNGKPLKIHRANEAFMAIEIPPFAKVKVTFSFDAPLWRKSLWITASAWCLLVLVLLFLAFRKQSNTNAER